MPTSFMFDASGGAPITCCWACTAVPQAAKAIATDTIPNEVASLKRWRIDFLPTESCAFVDRRAVCIASYLASSDDRPPAGAARFTTIVMPVRSEGPLAPWHLYARR